MAPMFFTIGNNRTVKVIPNIQARMNGHPVLTYTYNIYRSNSFDDKEEQRQESELLLEKKTDPNYMGYITFEEPGKIFTYIADGFDELSVNEVEEIIENISHHRDHPGMWDLEGAGEL